MRTSRAAQVEASLHNLAVLIRDALQSPLHEHHALFAPGFSSFCDANQQMPSRVHAVTV